MAQKSSQFEGPPFESISDVYPLYRDDSLKSTQK